MTSGLSCFRMIFSESLETSVREMLVIEFKNLEKKVAL
jgi:hypothetical protein